MKLIKLDILLGPVVENSTNTVNPTNLIDGFFFSFVIFQAMRLKWSNPNRRCSSAYIMYLVYRHAITNMQKKKKTNTLKRSR